MYKEVLRAKINDMLGHSDKDGTYYYCLTRVKEAFSYGTMSLDDFVEVDEDFTEQLVDLVDQEITSLRADYDQVMNMYIAASKSRDKIVRERDENRQVIENLRKELAVTDSDLEKIERDNAILLKFVRVCIGAAFQGGDMDGGSIQDLAVKLGILVETQYDPEKHGEDGLSIADPGDTWHVYADQYSMN